MQLRALRVLADLLARLLRLLLADWASLEAVLVVVRKVW